MAPLTSASTTSRSCDPGQYADLRALPVWAADLGVLVGFPVACGWNWWYDADDVVIEYGERVSIPGRWQPMST